MEVRRDRRQQRPDSRARGIAIDSSVVYVRDERIELARRFTRNRRIDRRVPNTSVNRCERNRR